VRNTSCRKCHTENKHKRASKVGTRSAEDLVQDFVNRLPAAQQAALHCTIDTKAVYYL